MVLCQAVRLANALARPPHHQVNVDALLLSSLSHLRTVSRRNRRIGYDEKSPTGGRNPLAERNEQYAIERWQTMHNRWWNEVKPAE